MGRWVRGILEMRDVEDVRCRGYGMFRLWDVWDVECSGCGFSGYGMFGM